MLTSLLWQCLTVSFFTPALLRTHSLCFLCCARNPQNLSKPFHIKGVKKCFFIPSECPAFTAIHCYIQATLALSLVVYLLKSVCCDFYIFCSDIPIACPFNLVWNSVVHSVFCNQGSKVRERIHLLQFLILNEYMACYAIACHYLGLVDVDE